MWLIYIYKKNKKQKKPQSNRLQNWLNSSLKLLFSPFPLHSCHLGQGVGLTSLSWALFNQLPACSHKQQPGRWWMSSRLGSDRFFKKMPRLCWPTLLFPPNHLSSRASAGCHGDLRPARRVIRGLDSLCDCWLGHAAGKVGYVSGRWVAAAAAVAWHLINAATITGHWVGNSVAKPHHSFFRVT